MTFRLPGPLAITVAQVDQMSGGRIELGLGTGWFEAEHAAYGIPFPPVGERFDLLEEQLAIITGLWTTPEGQAFSFDGAHYRVTDSPGLPKPAQRPRPPVLLGGRGTRRLDPGVSRVFLELWTAIGFLRVTGATNIAEAVRRNALQVRTLFGKPGSFNQSRALALRPPSIDLNGPSAYDPKRRAVAGPGAA